MTYTKRKIKSIIITTVVVLIVLWSAIGIDYSGLSSFSWKFVSGVFSGLSKPDWLFIYDGSGEDLISLLILTLGIAFLGTFIATVLALPFAMFSASNHWKKNKWISRIGKVILNILRAFPELVFAIIFVKVVGPGPYAGALAIGVHQIGMLGKLFTEEFEAVDEDLIESMESVGASFWQIMIYTRLPKAMPLFSSLILNHFEIALRSAATLGLVGAGGIGAPLVFAIQSRQFDRVSIILLGVVLTVFILDLITEHIRKKLK